MNQQKQNGNIIAIITMFFLFAMISFVTNLAAPFGTIWKNQYAGANTLGMMGNMMNFLAYLFMGIPSGNMLVKIGYKKTALIAMAVGFIGLFIQYISSLFGADIDVFNLGEYAIKMNFIIYLLGAFVCGFCVCMLNTVVNPMLNTLGGGGKKGNQLIQTGGSLNSLSATIVPVLVGYLMGANVEERTIAKALPALYIAMAIFAIAFLVLFFMAIPEPSLSKANKSKGEHSPLSFRHFKLGTIAIFVYVGIEVGIPHFANLFMTAQVNEGGLGIDPAIAGSIVGTYWFLMLIGRLIGASLGAQFSSKAMLTVASILGLVLIGIAFVTPLSSVVNMPVFKSGASLSFGLEAVPVSVMCMALCGLCTSIMWGGIFNLAVEGLGKYTEAASGIFMVMVCGGGILPLIQGAVADAGGFITSFWVVFLGLAYLLYYALIGSKNVNKDIPVE